MPWEKITMKEQRLKFVRTVLDQHQHRTFEDICLEFGVSRRTGYKWLQRYQQEGEQGLLDRSRRPLTCPRKISYEIEELAVRLKKENPVWGPKKICALMQERYPNLKVPSASTLGVFFERHQLVRPRKYRKHVAQTAPLKGYDFPNAAWLIDYKGPIVVGDGSRLEPFTITDAFSRFALACDYMPRKRLCDVWEMLIEAFCKYGKPLRIRSDNGPPFASLGVGRLSKLSILLIKAGITPEWIEPGCPQQNGRHERFHLTLKQEAANPPAATKQGQLLKIKKFVERYNNERPHEALDFQKPADIYISSDRKWDGKLRSPEYSADYEVKVPCKGGYIYWEGMKFYLSQNLWKEPVGIKEITVDAMGVYYGPILLGEIDLAKGFRKK